MAAVPRMTRAAPASRYLRTVSSERIPPPISTRSDVSLAIFAAVGKENILGCQFHPEKSGEVGLNILRAFCEMR